MRYVFCVLMVVFGMTVYGQNPNPSAAVDQVILDEMNSEKLPGVATVIVKDGEIVWLQAYGLADVQNNIPVSDSTIFMLASISKVFTGTSVMQLYEDGLINLDEDINNYLAFDIDVPGFESDSITFRQLMTHSGSIADGAAMDGYYDYPDPSITLADCIERYFSTSGADYNASQNFLNNAPGTINEYSNMGTALNGYMVEAVTGTPFDQYCDQNIFAPLCMYNTSWFISAYDTNNVARPHQYTGGQYVPYAHYGFADYPDGQLRTNTLDLANFMIATLQGGSFNNNQFLSSSSITEMMTVQDANLDQTQGLNYYQEEIYHSNGTAWLWGHNGGESGVSTDMYFDPANNIGFAVLTNGEGSALYICDELYDYALGLSASGVGNPSCAPVGIDESAALASNLQVYPNPITDQGVIKLDEDYIGNVTLELRDVTGKLLSSQAFSDSQLITIDGTNLTTGIYFFSVIGDSEALLGTGKFLVE